MNEPKAKKMRTADRAAHERTEKCIIYLIYMRYMQRKKCIQHTHTQTHAQTHRQALPKAFRDTGNHAHMASWHWQCGVAKCALYTHAYTQSC